MPKVWLPAIVLLLAGVNAHAGTTLERVRQTGTLRCGINQETPEYSSSDDHGARAAFDGDLCKAVAVAILGPNARVVTTGYDDDVTSMDALRTHAVDLLPTLTLDLTHSVGTGVTFSRPVLYDGVGVLVPVSKGFEQGRQLSGKTVCFLAETQVEVALRAWFAEEKLKFVPFPFQEEGEMEAAFVTDNCTALAGDRTRLATTRLGFGPLAGRFVMLPDQISNDPLAAASRADDPAFAAIVKWTMEVLVLAEEDGLTQSEAARHDAGMGVKGSALLGETHETGSELGLDEGWVRRVIAAVGNYGEIYARDLGSGSPLKLARGQNRLYKDGGLMQALPVK
jgi:general L-amino acid transport system substrate-binding protein